MAGGESPLEDSGVATAPSVSTDVIAEPPAKMIWVVVTRPVAFVMGTLDVLRGAGIEDCNEVIGSDVSVSTMGYVH
jgi:hypothetical protein